MRERPGGWWLFVLAWLAIFIIYGAIVFLVAVLPALEVARVFMVGK